MASGISATISAVIAGTAGLTKAGLGTLTVSGANTYTGATAVNAGTLQAGATNTFAPTSAFTIASGATLGLNNFNQTIGSLAGAGTVTNGGAANRTLTTGGDNTSTAFSGVIQDGAAGATNLTKARNSLGSNEALPLFLIKIPLFFLGKSSFPGRRQCESQLF
jgi:autotransporter-associated beta strand protein